MQQMNIVSPNPTPNALIALDGDSVEVLGLDLAGFEIKRQGSTTSRIVDSELTLALEQLLLLPCTTTFSRRISALAVY
jgi:hypothetical protein